MCKKVLELLTHIVVAVHAHGFNLCGAQVRVVRREVEEDLSWCC